MKIFPLISSCLRALVRNPMRAVLSVLGIVIGIAAVVAITEVGGGSTQAIEEKMATMGPDIITVFAASSNTAGVNSGKGGKASLFPEDAIAIMQNCPQEVLLASPMVRGNNQIIARGKNWSPYSIMGGNEHYMELENLKVAEGRAFNKEDVDNASRVCLVGETIVEELFDNQNPVGEELRIGDVMFTIIGSLESKGAGMRGEDLDDLVILPWTSIRMRLKGSPTVATLSKAVASSNKSVSATSKYSTTGILFYPGVGNDVQPFTNAPHPMRTRTVDYINVKIKDPERSKQAIAEITTALRAKHGLVPGQLDDFSLRDRAQFAEMFTSTSRRMSSLLTVVAMISLVVGGVGIMNIMLVSVTERTKEIGLRMAVGARPRDILSQFLIEAIVLCLSGGLIGIALGRLASWIISQELGWATISSPSAMALAVSVSAIIGIVFGWYPAWKASRLDPIDALRHE